jgi:hypothetical protein
MLGRSDIEWDVLKGCFQKFPLIILLLRPSEISSYAYELVRGMPYQFYIIIRGQVVIVLTSWRSIVF